MLPLCILSFLLSLTQAVFAGGGSSSNISIPRSSEKIVNVNLEFSSGKLEIESDEIKDILEAEISFSTETQRPKMTYEILEDSIGYFRLFPINKKMSILNSSDFDENHWRIFLTDDLKFDLNFSLGAAEADFDLADLRLTNFTLENGIGEVVLKCGKQSQSSLQKIFIESGVGEISFYDILNTNFEELYFEGGVGEYIFQFTGNHISKSAKAEITAGFSEIEIFLQKGISVEIKEEASIFTDKNYEKFEKVGPSLYRNIGFDRNDFILYLKIELGFGEFNVNWEEPISQKGSKN
ncbi:MAG: hypothetical protein DWQ06_11165 [Calditrichaeota bacterium]|nr:MAG: hypothetical protein DWQ06_11165 [Calditrichota bacterium]